MAHPVHLVDLIGFGQVARVAELVTGKYIRTPKRR